MIISKTPFRISFCGGGTDYREFFNENGGSIIGTTIDKYCYVTLKKLPRYFGYNNQVVYSKIESTNTLDEIEHPAVREAMRLLGMDNLRIVYDADLPARSGIGSSSAFTVGMLNAMHAIKGEYIDKYNLAKEAIVVERERCAESGGWQDQVAVAYGGFNRIYFSNDNFRVKPLIIPDERKKSLNMNLFLFFTGISRYSCMYSEEQEKNIKNKKADLLEMLNLVDDAEEILCSGRDLDEFGRLLDYTWKLKKGISTYISNDRIDMLYEKAIKSGAIGGKLLGAGGGGFIVFYVPFEIRENFQRNMKEVMNIPFCFENIGTSIIYSVDDTIYW